MLCCSINKVFYLLIYIYIFTESQIMKGLDASAQGTGQLFVCGQVILQYKW